VLTAILVHHSVLAVLLVHSVFTLISSTHSNTFTKEDTGLSDEDYSEAESIPEQVLEMA